VTIYQIVNWNEHFENAKSRTVERCSFVAIPNKQHGMGLTRILSSQDGAAKFGIWCLILQACSRHVTNKDQVRDGWLTDNGLPDGKPWEVEDMALSWRQPTALIESALALFSDVKVGWMARYDKCPPSIRQVSAKYPPDTLGREGKGREQKGEAPATPPPPSFETKQPPSPPRAGTSEPSMRLLDMLKLYGATLTMGTDPIFHEWEQFLEDYSVQEIEAALKDPSKPRKPSTARKVLKRNHRRFQDAKKPPPAPKPPELTETERFRRAAYLQAARDKFTKAQEGAAS
jgi:hypothetical protein